MGNLLLENGSDLFHLDNRDILREGAVSSVRKAEEFGESQYTEFVAERLDEQ